MWWQCAPSPAVNVRVFFIAFTCEHNIYYIHVIYNDSYWFSWKSWRGGGWGAVRTRSTSPVTAMKLLMAQIGKSGDSSSSSCLETRRHVSRAECVTERGMRKTGSDTLLWKVDQRRVTQRAVLKEPGCQCITSMLRACGPWNREPVLSLQGFF